jgi:hypothetical protein
LYSLLAIVLIFPYIYIIYHSVLVSF